MTKSTEKKQPTILCLTAKLTIDTTNPAAKQYVKQSDYIEDEVAELAELAALVIPKKKPALVKTKAGSTLQLTCSKK